MKIATFNINSIRKRLPNLQAWLAKFQPDIVLLQELKCVEEQFPRLELEAAGYRSAMVGQKSYNGVAILARTKIEVVASRLPGGPEDEHARYIEAMVECPGMALRVASIYLPNGNPAPGEKYDYKLRFMERLRQHFAQLVLLDEAVVLGGDYNVAPTDDDVYDPIAWADDALCLPATRLAFRAMINLGYTDAFRALNPQGHRYSYWDYQAGAWQRDNGLRIDHLLLSPPAADRLKASGIDRGPRGQPEPSDHTPVWCELKLD